jgi:predicted NUDIX family NTP pyrophosphohydrolase
MTIMRGRGVIVPVDWDENGNVVTVALAAHGEDEYVIDSQEKGEELKNLIQQEVEVIGEVRKKDGKIIIRVREYKLKTHRK